MNSVIEYTGVITVRMKHKKDIIIKNNGTHQLFRSLIRALELPHISSEVTSDDIRDTMPVAVQLYCYDKEWNPDDPLNTANLQYYLLNKMSIVRCTTVYEGSPKITYAFYLTQSNLWTNYSSSDDTILRNYSYLTLLDKNNNALAYIKLDLASLELKNWRSESQASITWELSFDNAPQTTTPGGIT